MDIIIKVVVAGILFVTRRLGGVLVNRFSIACLVRRIPFKYNGRLFSHSTMKLCVGILQ